MTGYVRVVYRVCSHQLNIKYYLQVCWSGCIFTVKMSNSSIIDQIDKHISQLELEIQKLKQARQLLGSTEPINGAIPTPETNKPLEINHNDYLSNSEATKAFIKRKNRFTHIREVVEFFHTEMGINDIESARGKAKNSMQTLKTNNEIIKVVIANRQEFTFWGFPEWLGQNGVILRGHEFDKNMLIEIANK